MSISEKWSRPIYLTIMLNIIVMRLNSLFYFIITECTFLSIHTGRLRRCMLPVDVSFTSSVWNFIYPIPSACIRVIILIIVPGTILVCRMFYELPKTKCCQNNYLSKMSHWFNVGITTKSGNYIKTFME